MLFYPCREYRECTTEILDLKEMLPGLLVTCYSFVVISDELDSSLASVIRRLTSKSSDKIPCGLKTRVALPPIGILTEPGRVDIDNRENVV